jgi:galactokinase
VASKTDGNTVTLISENYPGRFVADLSQLDPVKGEEGKTGSLIRGIAAYLKNNGFSVGGFNAYIASEVKQGSGLSSSASVEVLIACILNSLYNGGRIPYVRMALAGQFAENNFFGKPCGLMDQVACAAGGIVTIDFKDPAKPVIEQIAYDFNRKGYDLLVVDTGQNHEDLTEDYASIPAEMKSVAAVLGKKVAREVGYDELFGRMGELREKTSDRAVLRVLHFLAENERVRTQVKALKTNKLDVFLYLVNASGDSSIKWLQNCHTDKNPGNQGIPLALALTEKFLGDEGACRVHGGGFGGTILVFLPSKSLEEYTVLMDHVFGANAVTRLAIRAVGAVQLA